MDKLKKIVLTGAVVSFSTLAIYNSFANRDEIELNSANSREMKSENSVLVNKWPEESFLKEYLKQDLSQNEKDDAMESMIYFKNLVKKNYNNPDNLEQIKNTFFDHIEKYIDENKIDEFRKFIQEKFNLIKNWTIKKEYRINKIEDRNDEEEEEEDQSGSLDKDYSSGSLEQHRKEDRKKEFINNNSWSLERNQTWSLERNKDIKKLGEIKKDLSKKYSKLINNIPKDKLPVILERINWKILEVTNSNLKQEAKDKSLAMLNALAELINERISSSINDISVEELLK